MRLVSAATYTTGLVSAATYTAGLVSATTLLARSLAHGCPS
jgi:hypothetical protein